MALFGAIIGVPFAYVVSIFQFECHCGRQPKNAEKLLPFKGSQLKVYGVLF